MKGDRVDPASESNGLPGKPVRILHLEDNLNDAELVEAEIRGAGIACTLQRVETHEAFLQALEREGLDLILSDFSLPAFDGLSALRLARKHRPEVPFIFVSGAISEEATIEALKYVATDYVPKGRLSKLRPAVVRALSEAASGRSGRCAPRRRASTGSLCSTPSPASPTGRSPRTGWRSP